MIRWYEPLEQRGNVEIKAAGRLIDFVKKKWRQFVLREVSAARKTLFTTASPLRFTLQIQPGALKPRTRSW
jgi:hypothetical protein